MTEKEKILFCDDEVNFRRVVKDYLERVLPYTVEDFGNALDFEARLKLGLEGVVAVLVDNEFPDTASDTAIIHPGQKTPENGSRIIATYSHTREFRKVPFIFCYGGHEVIGLRALKHGAFAYLRKPVEMRELVNVIRKGIAVRQQDLIENLLA